MKQLGIDFRLPIKCGREHPFQRFQVILKQIPWSVNRYPVQTILSTSSNTAHLFSQLGSTLKRSLQFCKKFNGESFGKNLKSEEWKMAEILIKYWEARSSWDTRYILNEVRWFSGFINILARGLHQWHKPSVSCALWKFEEGINQICRMHWLPNYISRDSQLSFLCHFLTFHFFCIFR
jgi:hypothetical protein